MKTKRESIKLHEAAAILEKSLSQIKIYCTRKILPYHLTLHGREVYKEDVIALKDSIPSKLQKRGRKPKRQ